MKKILGVLGILLLATVQAKKDLVEGSLLVLCMSKATAEKMFERDKFTEEVIGTTNGDEQYTFSIWRGTYKGAKRWMLTVFNPKLDIICRVGNGGDKIPTEPETSEPKKHKSIDDMK